MWQDNGAGDENDDEFDVDPSTSSESGVTSPCSSDAEAKEEDRWGRSSYRNALSNPSAASLVTDSQPSINPHYNLAHNGNMPQPEPLDPFDFSFAPLDTEDPNAFDPTLAAMLAL